MLGDSIDMSVSWEGDVQPHTLWSSGLGVGISTERLLPPVALIFIGIAVDLRAPLFHIEVALVVELHVSLPVSLELHIERRMVNDCLVFLARSVKNLGQPGLRIRVQRRRLASVQTTNQDPFLRIIISFLARLTAVSHFDITLQPLLFINDNPGCSGLEEGHRERQSDFFIVRSGLYYASLQKTVLEMD